MSHVRNITEQHYVNTTKYWKTNKKMWASLQFHLRRLNHSFVMSRMTQLNPALILILALTLRVKTVKRMDGCYFNRRP